MSRNAAIGTVECPFKHCTEHIPVFKFRKRAPDEKLTRHAGKLYAECPKHGRINDQEYLLSNAKLDSPAEKNAAAPAAPATSQPQTAATPPAPPARKKPTPGTAAVGNRSASTAAPGSNSKAPEKRPWWMPLISS